MRLTPAPPILSLTLLLGLALLPPLEAQGQSPPDLTRGGRVPEGWTHDWTLGPTGARGWIWAEKLVTTDARQILVTSVAPGSPAHGVLREGDVILGVGDADFDGDARQLFGRAITEAEREKNRGRLKLRVWRQGKRGQVTIKLRKFGDYAPTAPFDCRKSKRILDTGCQALARRMEAAPRKGHVITRALNALALLATGERKYLPIVRRQAELLADFEQGPGVRTWQYAYVNLFLAEYVLATKDRGVARRGLRRLTQRIVDGQSEVGSWGHDFVQEETGRLRGYGMMNAPGIPLTLSLALARRAEVQVQGLDEAIKRSLRLLRFYVGKGSIPYGDHRPWIEAHCDNGKNEMAAVLFDLEGDAEAATYFSRMAVASHGSERDTGHTGNFFNLTWALLGVARSGPEATGAWMEEYGWYYDLARGWDGRFLYQGEPAPKPEAYRGWDCSGAYLLAYALPRRELYLTGRQQACAEQVDRETAESLVDDGRGWTNRDRHLFYDSLAAKELLRRLGSWSPVVRERAALALGRRKQLKVLPQLMRLLASKDPYTRLGACRALRHQGRRGAGAVEGLMRLVARAKDPWLRIQAAEALAGIGGAARKAVPLLLAKLERAPGPDDPRDMERRYLTFALFSRREGLLGRSLEDVDRRALLRAVRASLRNPDGRARGAVASVYKNLDFAQLRPLLPAIRDAIAEPAPTGIMFSNEIRMAGLELFARHHVDEGIELLAHYARHQKQHGSEKRIKKVLTLLESYGAHARRVLPELEKTARYFDEEEKNFPRRLSRQKAQAVRESMQRISASDHRPRLLRLPRPRAR
jgi:hypothetical protein